MKLYQLLKVLAPSEEMIVINGEFKKLNEGFYCNIEEFGGLRKLTRLSKKETDREVTEVSSGTNSYTFIEIKVKEC